MTGDLNPLYVDESYGAASRYRGRIAPGILTAGLVVAVLSTKMPGPGTILEHQEFRFTAPVRPGDAITAFVEVVEVLPSRGDGTGYGAAVTYEEALAYIYGLLGERPRSPHPYSPLKLERMRHLCALLDHPERHFPAVLVAGTKGKGSTAAMIAAMAAAAGFRVGLYTKPHLVDFRERIRING